MKKVARSKEWGWSTVVLLLALSAGCVPLRTYSPMTTTTTAHSEGSSSQVSASPQPVSSTHLIRVAVAVKEPSAQLLVPSGASVTGISALNARTVEKDGLKYYSLDLTVHDLQGVAIFRSNDNGDIQVNGNHYKGTIEVIERADGYLTVVNQLPMEDYIMGVLAGEVPSSWPLETLKAQAIAARTFAVYKQAESHRKSLDYDLENNTQFQMYIGSRLVNENIRQAVLQTQDEIMTYRDQPIMAVFHSNCGGETTGSEAVWGQNLPYLRPVNCSFDRNGKHYLWRTEMPAAEAARHLRDSKIDLYDIAQVSSIQRDSGGRVSSLVLTDGEGNRKKVKGTVFRMALGPDLVRSTRFEVKLNGTELMLTGTGWGHGVGMCQDGACGMAKAGYGAFDILRHYYYGISVEKMRAN